MAQTDSLPDLVLDSLRRRDLSPLEEWLCSAPSHQGKEQLSLLLLTFLKQEMYTLDYLEEYISGWLNFTESLLPDNYANLCEIASLYYRFGALYQKGRYFLLALDKIAIASELKPEYMVDRSDLLQLWGNILIELGRLLKEEKFVEEAIEKYEKALALEKSFHCLWDCGSAWILLGKLSLETSDLKRGIDCFSKATSTSSALMLPHFWIHYGEALMTLGSMTGDPTPLKEGVELLKIAISKTFHNSQNKTAAAYVKAWSLYALCHKKIFELTGNREDFDRADSVFQEAIIAVPKEKALWLDWGELYLNSGWQRRNVLEIETSLEKFSALKVDECSPLLATAYLGQGVALLGFLLEDLKLINEGKERVLAIVGLHPNQPELIYAAGIVHLSLALYFSEDSNFATAIDYFRRGLHISPNHPKFIHALFQTYLEWGIEKENIEYIVESEQWIDRLINFRPFSSIHYLEWGELFMRKQLLEESKDERERLVEEAIEKFKKAMALHGDVEVQFHHGCALDILGDITGEEEYYQEAISLLSQIHDKIPDETQIQYALASALSHFGELTAQPEYLFEAATLLETLANCDSEDEEIWCQLGYTLLNLSELAKDPNHPQKSEEVRRKAEKRLVHAVELGSSEANYHLACLYALAGLADQAMHFLKRAETHKSLPTIEDLENDEWLSSLNHTSAFREFIATRRQY
ncbi:MAG: hypothetical protein ACKVOH_05810 [Chlamydiales bacterium]